MSATEQFIARRGPALIAVMAVLTAILTAATIYLVTGAIDREGRLRVIEREAACTLDARSPECRQTRRRTLRNENPRVTCIAFRNVGYPCPVPESAPRAARSDGAGAGADLPDASTPQVVAPTTTTPSATTAPPEPDDPANPGNGQSGDSANSDTGVDSDLGGNGGQPESDDSLTGPVIDGVCESADGLGLNLC